MTLDPDHIDWSATGAMLAAIIAAAAFVISLLSWRTAQQAAADAKRLADAEVERRHEELDPKPVVTFKIEAGEDRGGNNLFATITPTRPCRIQGRAMDDENSSRPLMIPLPIKANVPVRIHIERLPEGREQPTTQHLQLRIWVPVKTDEVAQWSCPCHRPGEQSDDRAPGHWEHTVQVADIEREPFFGVAFA